MLSQLFYNAFIRLYYVGAVLVSPFNVKAAAWLKGRNKFIKESAKFNKTFPTGKRIWFHCASLGEFEQARPVIELIKKRNPEYRIILTFFSPSGYEIRKKYKYADCVCYLPLDTADNAKYFVKEMKPDLVIWVKYEFWYHHLQELYANKIPLVLISSVFRPNHVFFKKWGALHRKMLTFFSHIFVQDESSQTLLRDMGVSAEIALDTRFDRVLEISQTKKEFKSIEIFKEDSKVIVAGSTWKKDEDFFIRIINNKILPNCKFIIAPHNIHHKTLKSLLHSIKLKKIFLSKLNEGNADLYDVIIVDTMGNLSSLYAYGDIAYVGGGFGEAVHNLLEPAVYGMPLVFGPNHHKALEATELMKLGAAIRVKNYEGLRDALKRFLKDETRSKAAERAKEYVLSHIGGTEKIYQYLQANSWL